MSVFAEAVGSRHRWQYVAIAVLTAIMTLQVVQTWKGPTDPSRRYVDVARDFKAFYCAGATANAREDPYLIEPFERCGSKPPTAPPSFVRNGVSPAPIPPYDLAIFRFLAMFPYVVAASLWLVVSVAGLTCVVILMSSLSSLPPLAVFATVALPYYYNCLSWGQLPPLVLFMLALAAYALRKTAYVTAGVACVATLVEPHVGVPVCIAVALWVPRTRVVVGAGVAALALTGIVEIGFPANVEYYRTILPLHIRAEVPAGYQYSFAWLAYVARAAEPLAIKLGTISYVVMVALGTLTAGAFARRNGGAAVIPLVPAAFAVFGGVFVHAWQMSFAVLLSMMLIPHARERALWLWLSLALQAPFWADEIWTTRPFTLTRIESTLAIATLAAFALSSQSIARRLAAAFASGLAYIAISTALLHTPETPIRVSATAAAYDAALGSDRRYASGKWGVSIRAEPSNRITTVAAIVGKLPRWLGLLISIIITLTIAFESGKQLRSRARSARVA